VTAAGPSALAATSQFATTVSVIGIRASNATSGFVTTVSTQLSAPSAPDRGAAHAAVLRALAVTSYFATPVC
jgi:hypothetical protein